MKIFKIKYSEDIPVYDIEVEAENISKTVDKARNIIFDEKDIEIDIWNIEEKMKLQLTTRSNPFDYLKSPSNIL